MAEIGISKSQGLFARFNEDRENLRKKWSDFDTKPLVYKDNIDDNIYSEKGSSEFQSKLVTAITARKDDVVRITKLLGKAGGIRWEAHQLELETIQNNLEAKRASIPNKDTGKSEGNSKLLTTLKSAGQSLASNIGLTASTLLQVGVSGTGEHQTPFLGRAYLDEDAGDSSKYGKQLLNSLLTSTGVINGSKILGANSAKEGALIPDRNNVPIRLEEAQGNSKYRLGSGFKYDKGTVESDKVKNSSLVYLPTHSYTDAEPYVGKIVHGSSSMPLRYLGYGVHQASPENPRTDRNGYRWDTKVMQSIDDSAEYRKDERKVESYIGRGTYIKSTDTKSTSSYESQEEPGILSTEQSYEDFNQIPFEIVTYSGPTFNKQYLYFKANLGGIDDNYNSTWDAAQYVGRADKFYTYTGFERKISFSFMVLARRQEHLVPLYQKLNVLAASTAPSYGQDGSFMRGTFSQITIGDYLYKQDGFFTSVKLSWKQEDPWETEGEVIKVPHVLDVSVEFTPIQNFIPKNTVDFANSRVYFGGNNKLSNV